MTLARLLNSCEEFDEITIKIIDKMPCDPFDPIDDTKVVGTYGFIKEIPSNYMNSLVGMWSMNWEGLDLEVCIYD